MHNARVYFTPFYILLAMILLSGCGQSGTQITPTGVFATKAIAPALSPSGALCVFDLSDRPYTYLYESGYRLLSEALSPDGRFLLISTGKLGYVSDYEVFMANLETGEISQLTDNRDEDYSATWSLAGDWITFIHFPQAGFRDNGLYRMPIDGSFRERIVDGTVYDYTLSPDGEFVAYASVSRTLLRTLIDGSGEPEVLVADGMPSSPVLAWSPDGNQIAFVRGVAGEDNFAGQLSIYQLADNSTRTALDEAAHIGSIAWSPNSEWIIFSADWVGTPSFESADFYRIRPDGTDLEPLADCDI